MRVKCRRREFELGPEDIVMYNGICYQILTKKYSKGWDKLSPVIAKRKAEKMMKDGVLVVAKKAAWTAYYKIGKAGE